MKTKINVINFQLSTVGVSTYFRCVCMFYANLVKYMFNKTNFFHLLKFSKHLFCVNNYTKDV